MAMIRVDKLTVSFGLRVVIDGITFSVDKGETLAILGRNGSGKSVLLKTIGGLIDDYTGEITINGTCAGISPAGDGHDNCRLAYVFQKGGLLDSLNVFDNVAFGIRRAGFDEEELFLKVTGIIERVGLKGNEGKLPSELSGGMQKRAGFARALCMQPDVILYDEPTAGLDPILSDSIGDLMREIKSSSGITSMLVTNDLALTKKVADNTALLYGGKFVAYSTTEDFFRERNDYTRQFIRGELTGPINIME